MLMPARKVLWLCLLVLLPHNAMAAMDGPNNHLWGINIISYQVIVEKTIGGEQCTVDQDNLNTAIEFVANQSAKLKIVPASQREHRSAELFRQSQVTSPDQEAAKKTWHDYNFMPQFYIGIMPLQTTQFTCAASIDASLMAYINEEQLHLIPSQIPLWYPTTEIWAIRYGFVDAPQRFSNSAIEMAEQIMKKLVNDWAGSQ